MPHSAAGDAQIVVAFRTHIWNEDVARLARRLRHFAPGAACVVLMDDTKSPPAAGNFAELRHDGDFSALGLPSYPAEGTLWFNADYPLYLLRQAYPRATHYVMSEYDVAVNTDIMPMLRQAQAEAVDMIAHDIRPSAPDWYWHYTACGHFEAPLRALIPFLVVSARAIDFMLRERRRIAVDKGISPASPKADWPFCEAFIPSAVAQLDNASIRNLSDFVGLPCFTFWPEQHADDPLMTRPGTISHPAIGGELFIKRCVHKAKSADIFAPHGRLLHQLQFCDPDKFAGILLENVRKEDDPEKLQKFIALARAQRWPLVALCENLALRKPALMSSALDGGGLGAAAAPDLAALAGGGNNGVIDGKFGFHTDFEAEPWWQVDLQQSAALYRVLVFNRLDQAPRCRRLRISGSLDGRQWRTLAEKTDDVLFGGADGRPLAVDLPARPVARFVRLTNLVPNYFHLDEVQILGEALA